VKDHASGIDDLPQRRGEVTAEPFLKRLLDCRKTFLEPVGIDLIV